MVSPALYIIWNSEVHRAPGIPLLKRSLGTLSRQVARGSPWVHLIRFLLSYIIKLHLLMPPCGKIASHILIIVAVIDIAIAVSGRKGDLVPEV